MIDWFVTSSALILLVLLLRVFTKSRISPRLRYALWLIVLARLLAPGTVWESRASVMTPVAAQEVYREIQQIPSYVRTLPDGGVEVGRPGGGGWTTVPAESVASHEPVFREEESGSSSTVSEKIRQVNVRNMFLLAWAAGVLAVGAFLLAVNLRFAARLGKHRRTLENYRGRWVFVMEALASPCLFGLFRPGIYLTPEVAADEDAKAHVLAHEFAHFRQRDHIWAALRGACLALHWYNPLVWLAAYLSRRDCELSCDEGAVRLLGEEHRADYGRTLVGLVARRTTPADLARCATTMTGGKSALKERVALLVKRPRTTAVMAVLVAAACIVFAACTFTGAARAEEREEPTAPDAPPAETETASDEGYEEAIRRRLAVEYGEHTLDCRINSLDILEWQYDLDTGDYQAVFGAEIMVLVPEEERNSANWWAGNTAAAANMEDDFYRDYDGWLVFWRRGIAARDGASGDWRILEMGTGGYDLDYMEDRGLVDTAGGDYVRFRALPEDLPAEVSLEGGQWLMLAALPGEDIALYCNRYDMETIYLRYGDVFQAFKQDLFQHDKLPEMSRANEDCVVLQYCQEDGRVSDLVTYRWNGGYWTDAHLPSFIEPQSLPALEDLPAAMIDVPGAYQDPIWKVAELPEDDIAVYYEQETNRSLLRYGKSLQLLYTGGKPLTTPRMLPAGLHFEDLDGDGEKELAVIYNSDSGTGCSVWSLTVLEWDGETWTAHTARLEDEIIRDFETSRTVALHPEEDYVTVGFRGHTVDVDMNAMFGGSTIWKDEPMACEITGMYSSYSRESYGLILSMEGELRPQSYAPTTSYGFRYVCDVCYEADGTFRTAADYLDTDYRRVPEADGSLITPVFREILQRFIAHCRAVGLEDLSTENFAICDVNGDGGNELITQRNNTVTPGRMETVYNQYGTEILSGYPLMTYYDNGYVQAGWSHNQGKAGEKLWPYTLCRTTGAGWSRRYTTAAVIDGWDKSLGDTYLSYTGESIPFPDDVDKDGDGFVYYLITGEEGGYAPEYGTPMDYAEYANWAAVFLGANVVKPAYIPLTEENIALIEQN